jgi:hypothetical protein
VQRVLVPLGDNDPHVGDLLAALPAQDFPVGGGEEVPPLAVERLDAVQAAPQSVGVEDVAFGEGNQHLEGFRGEDLAAGHLDVPHRVLRALHDGHDDGGLALGRRLVGLLIGLGLLLGLLLQPLLALALRFVGGRFLGWRRRLLLLVLLGVLLGELHDGGLEDHIQPALGQVGGAHRFQLLAELEGMVLVFLGEHPLETGLDGLLHHPLEGPVGVDGVSGEIDLLDEGLGAGLDAEGDLLGVLAGVLHLGLDRRAQIPLLLVQPLDLLLHGADLLPVQGLVDADRQIPLLQALLHRRLGDHLGLAVGDRHHHRTLPDVKDHDLAVRGVQGLHPQVVEQVRIPDGAELPADLIGMVGLARAQGGETEEPGVGDAPVPLDPHIHDEDLIASRRRELGTRGGIRNSRGGKPGGQERSEKKKKGSSPLPSA